MLLFGHTVECWGENAHGPLGNDFDMSSSTPVAVKSLVTKTYVSAGGDHACALLSGGTVECWGYNSDGELGDGRKTYSPTPVQPFGATNTIQVSAG